MAFKNNNESFGLPANNNFQVGVSDIDLEVPGAQERGFLLPYPSDPEYSWVYYECNITVMLDSGIVVHSRLPQIDNAPDSLGAVNYADPKLPELGALGDGVNLKSRDQYEDTVQRMAHSRYWFRLWGQALRVGLQVPIPRLVKIGGVPAIPYDEKPQMAFNRIAPGGNYGGLILWHAAWSLWYTTARPPVNNEIPAIDPSAQIDGSAKPPKGMQTPYDQPDTDAVTVPPPIKPIKAEANFLGGINARVR